MSTRQLAIGLVLAAVALLTVVVIFNPSTSTSLFGPASTAATPTTAGSPTKPHKHKAAGPSVAPKAGPRTSAGPSASTSAKPGTSSAPPDAPEPSQPTTKSSKASEADIPKVVRPAKPVKAGSRGVVFLTFDDGPSPYTPAVLKILTETKSTATFFEMGNHVRAYPSLVQQVRAQGSTIGNHTYDHPDLTTLSKARLRWELANGPAAHCVRPPYGATNAKVLKAIHRIGSVQVIWSVDTLDWTRPGAGVIAKRASGPNVHNGSIVLMHDGGGDRSQTVRALPVIIENLQLRGYVVRKLPGC